MTVATVTDNATCAVCSTSFFSKPFKYKGVWKIADTCSHTCRTLYRYGQTELKGDKARNSAKTARRQMILRTQMVETVDPLIVFERDKWICQLCNDPVDPKIPGRERMGASLDHITPLSVGGEHSYANTQLAHLHCNSSKNNGNKQSVYQGGGVWVLGPKPPRKCRDCTRFMTFLSGTSWRCYSCHPLVNATAEVKSNARSAYELRLTGESWIKIALKLNYKNQNQARQAATYYARKEGKDEVTRSYSRR